MKLSELREHAAAVEANPLTYRGAVYVELPSELVADIDQQIHNAYADGVNAADQKKWGPVRDAAYKQGVEWGQRNCQRCARMDGCGMDNLRPGVFPKVAYSAEEVDAKINVLRNDLIERLTMHSIHPSAHARELDVLREYMDPQGFLAKLTGRVDALEAHPERLGSSEKHIDRRVEWLEKAVNALRMGVVGILDVAPLKRGG